ncbi:MAG: adenylosuccinate lyase [Actinobacteria bacterium]|nr:adenylosuccinate lyase [Actinomycetota bacterium]MCB9390118.1 adenylosuccinate lyase [Acidimicrobiia bacterium]
MIPRYSLPAMADLFTDESKFGAWLEVELQVVDAYNELGMVSDEDARQCREKASFSVDAILERERITEHDVAAFVDVVQASIGQPAGGWIHFGLTSSDVVDTAQAIILTKAVDVLAEAVAELDAALSERAREFKDTVMVGRTHGIHAEPTTFGNALALMALQVRRDRERLARAREVIAVGKLSGAVGTYSNIDPRVEEIVCTSLGLKPVPATQVLARDRHAELLYVCASIGAAVETYALEIRHLQRTEVGEAEEGFREGAQKGSSAMPHKRNPVKSEQLTGLARVLRANVVAGLENVALWHERDISHSSVERIILADSLILCHYMVEKATGIVRRMRVNAERMIENLNSSYGLVFSQAVLLALVDSGLSRDEAYRLVQRNAMATWEQRRPFREVLGEDTAVLDALGAQRLDQCFDLGRSVANVGRTFDVLDAHPGAQS